MRRFLKNPQPEVLSISGRWGVGKTHAWNAILDEARAAREVSLPRYAYVSVFGLRSIDDLKTLIVQSTVRLNSESIEPTVESFNENLRSIDGFKNFLERSGRKGLSYIPALAALVPGGNKIADVLLPNAALLIKNQLVCIDDIERAGEGLKVQDILGFVSMLREERDCKVVLLLNEEGLGGETEVYRTYLEKVVDQAINYAPTPRESAEIALDMSVVVDRSLAERIATLGIINIRVIKRIRRFLGDLEPLLHLLHPAVLEQAISTIALLGWCIFEPKISPSLEYVKSYNRSRSLINKEEPSEQEAQWNSMMGAYGFFHIDEFDAAILSGLIAGGFDFEDIYRKGEILDYRLKREDIRQAIRLPWEIYSDSFDDNAEHLQQALVESVEKYADEMQPREISSVVDMLKSLGKEDKAKTLVAFYMKQQAKRPQECFNSNEYNYGGGLDPLIKEALDERFSVMATEKSLLEVLLKIERTSGWNPEDITFLASNSEDDYYKLFKITRGQELHDIIRSSLRFAHFHDENNHGYKEITRKAKAALRRIGSENELNAMRVRPYLSKIEEEHGEAPV